MIKVEHSVKIDRDPGDVFTYIVDPANSAKWDDDLVESKLVSEGPVGAGSVITDVRKFMGRDMDSELKVTAFEPGKTFAVKVTKGPVPFEFSYNFSPSGGGTKVDIKAEGEPSGFFKLAGGLLAKELQSSLEKTSALLKTNLET